MLRSMVNNTITYIKNSHSSHVNVNGYCSHEKRKNLDLEVNRMVWMDLEMTGLNIETDTIMEVACIITDQNLNIIAEGPDIIIHQPQNVLDNMSEWCKDTHGKSGLTQACLNSNVSVSEAEEKVMKFLCKFVTEKSSPLAGNSVYMDRMFIRKYMPKVHEYLHYRIIDVSTIKELCRRWNPEVYKTIPKKGFTHRALQDIQESIEELKFYQNSFFKMV
jgi:oligoribonuclease